MSVDQKRAFNKLKHDLEPWRNLIVHVDAVLSWEKKFYPAVIAAAITIFYVILWAMDLSTVTMLALAGLFALAVDFLYPSVSRFLFSPDNWSGDQEERFGRVCECLCAIKMALASWYDYLFQAKERKSTLFVIVVSVTLLAVAWIGAIIDNLLLMFVVTLTVAMFPGMQKQSVFDKLKSRFGCVVNSKIQQLREKTKKAD